MMVVDIGILWLFLGSALVVLRQAQAIRLAKTNRELASSEAALRARNAEAASRLSNVRSELSTEVTRRTFQISSPCEVKPRHWAPTLPRTRRSRWGEIA